MPTLYVVATPIGNLEDITLRALRVLGEVDLIAAEDTRVTRKLLARHGVKTRLASYHEHNYRRQLPKILASLEQQDVALVSDAGVPSVSDPGAELIAAAAELGVTIAPVPGPSAVTSAIAVSGMDAGQFAFLGFLPRRSAERKRLLDAVSADTKTLVAFETPHRLRKSLSDVNAVLGDRRIAVCRELTKLHEEIFRGTVSEALEHFANPIGEFTLVIHGADPGERDPGLLEQSAVDSLTSLRDEGARVKDAVARVVEQTGLPRSRVYKLWLDTGNDRQDGTTTL